MNYLKGVIVLGFALLMGHSVCGQSVTSEKLQQHVDFLASDAMEGRGFGTNEPARTYILEQFINAGLQPVRGSYLDTFDVRIANVRVTGVNIMGMISGNDPELKDEYIVLGAHYDHVGYKTEDGKKIIFNGADDNASGVASIIEIAKSFNNAGTKPGRSLLFVAFDGEESGLFGSKEFIQRATVPLKDIRLMLSLDMVGMYSANNGVDMRGIGSLEGGEAILNKISGDVKITKEGKAIALRTDTQPFGAKGIPAIHVFTGTKSPYHKPEDDSNLLDYEGMAQINNMIIRFVNEAAATEALDPIESLTAEVDEPEVKTFQAGFRLNVGSGYHNYTETYYKAKTSFALETGIYTQIRLNRNWRLQPEVIYEFKGSKHSMGDFRMHALTLPVNLLLTTGDPVGNQPMAYLSMGGYYSYNFEGTLDGTSLDFDNDYALDDYGISYGVGVQFRKIQMGFYSKYGLSSILKDPSVDAVHYNTNYFMMGWRF